VESQSRASTTRLPRVPAAGPLTLLTATNDPTLSHAHVLAEQLVCDPDAGRPTVPNPSSTHERTVHQAMNDECVHPRGTALADGGAVVATLADEHAVLLDEVRLRGADITEQRDCGRSRP
jgi:hypothetical protein